MSPVTDFSLPKLYAIVDPSFLTAGVTLSQLPATPGMARDVAGSEPLMNFIAGLLDGGVTLVQYRNKLATPSRLLSEARLIKQLVEEEGKGGVRLMMNDRADLALAAGFDGVHVGQDDLSAAAARMVVGDELLVGVSTHTPEHVREADLTAADYIAVGPIFDTSSKQDPAPVVGLDGLRQARLLTAKPLVAIGGISIGNCRAVMDAGADSVAILSALLHEPRRFAEAFLRALG